MACTLPTASMARTYIVWAVLVSGSGPTVYVAGHATKLAASMRHSNVAPASDVNVNCGLGSLLGSGGFVVMTATGAVRSTNHVALAGVGSTFPALSTARTSKVWKPSVS